VIAKKKRVEKLESRSDELTEMIFKNEKIKIINEDVFFIVSTMVFHEIRRYEKTSDFRQKTLVFICF
jgi:hypothetical protein